MLRTCAIETNLPPPERCGSISFDANNRTRQVAEMNNFPQIRLLQIFPSSASEPLLETENSGWRPAPQLAKQSSANFSAICVSLKHACEFIWPDQMMCYGNFSIS